MTHYVKYKQDGEEVPCITGNPGPDIFLDERFKHLEQLVESLLRHVGAISQTVNSNLALMDRLDNIEAYTRSVEIDLQEYANDNPKSSDQWVEERLRALEDQVKLFKVESVTIKGKKK